ncbi:MULTISPECIES: hypothetical protein [Streptomyces]|uniref:hypothetical protein n=1 Tax=Streptomyces TaxID=1883 RepID=UPI0024B76279|nr:hypothetical protein [Streptomyces sp. KAU_LT]MDI9832582.1 hypothetical protein [Streptomyces sp. KAU_LT]
MPRSSSTAAPSGGETTALVAQVVDELTRCMAQHSGDLSADFTHITGEARQGALARLHVLAGVKECVRHLEDQAAHAAAAHGAGYPEIGQAMNMSRQGARRRWPGLITSSTPHPTPRPRSS